jgi:hypothetical protein
LLNAAGCKVQSQPAKAFPCRRERKVSHASSAAKVLKLKGLPSHDKFLRAVFCILTNISALWIVEQHHFKPGNIGQALPPAVYACSSTCSARIPGLHLSAQNNTVIAILSAPPDHFHMSCQPLKPPACLDEQHTIRYNACLMPKPLAALGHEQAGHKIHPHTSPQLGSAIYTVPSYSHMPSNIYNMYTGLSLICSQASQASCTWRPY